MLDVVAAVSLILAVLSIGLFACWRSQRSRQAQRRRSGGLDEEGVVDDLQHAGDGVFPSFRVSVLLAEVDPHFEPVACGPRTPLSLERLSATKLPVMTTPGTTRNALPAYGTPARSPVTSTRPTEAHVHSIRARWCSNACHRAVAARTVPVCTSNAGV